MAMGERCRGVNCTKLITPVSYSTSGNIYKYPSRFEPKSSRRESAQAATAEAGWRDDETGTRGLMIGEELTRCVPYRVRKITRSSCTFAVTLSIRKS